MGVASRLPLAVHRRSSSVSCPLLLIFAADPLDGDEYLDITGIMRNQAGRYECKASNDVAMPDVKYVNVVVNCKYGGAAAGSLLRRN